MMAYRWVACRSTAFAAILALSGFACAAHAEEFYVGEPVVKNGMQLVPNYLVGIEMDKMPKGMTMGPNTIHLECDAHAAKDEPHGFAEDSWMPYLTISYTIEKVGSSFKATGTLLPMTAGDGPHYANNIEMDGPGQYHLTYRFDPPSKRGFLRHVDKATGVPAWWKPFSVDWTFAFPSKSKA
ncbi:MAG TPA: iron transporter [Stellaceae bacterium]|nr:iron transporter [Stellaceae bacterium]